MDKPEDANRKDVRHALRDETDRRIKAEDLFAYKEKRDPERAHILSDMAHEDAENGYL